MNARPAWALWPESVPTTAGVTAAAGPDAAPHEVSDFLKPGDFRFGGPQGCMRTLLGSCVAITMWHPVRRLGGMTHSLLPDRHGRDGVAPDGRFVDEALDWLLNEAVRAGTRPEDYEFKVFGGGDMFNSGEELRRVGAMNSAAALRLLQERGLFVVAHDLGGVQARTLVFDLPTGDVWVRYGPSRMSIDGPRGETP